MISVTAPTIASARNTRPEIGGRLEDSMMYARSPWWKRSRCVAVGAMKQPVETAVASRVAKNRSRWKSKSRA